jgi:predicted dienelactone hydrolase
MKATFSRRRFVRFPSILAICLATAALASCAGTKIPAPSGKYAIGTTSYTFTDPARAERYVADPAVHRQILVRVWYPAASVEGHKAMPYFTPALASALGKHMGIPRFMLSASPSHSFVDAPIYRAESAWPVIVFAHGFGSFDRQNQSQMEQFAGDGYVVVSLDFPYESVVCEFPDGRIVEQSSGGDVKAINDLSKDQKALAERIAGLFKAIQDAGDREARIAALEKLRDDPYFQAMRPAMESRFSDAVFVLEHLSELNSVPVLEGRLDEKRAGFYGHSFGGALAIEVAIRRPDLIAAVADMDSVFIDSSRSGFTVLKVPTLFMYSTEQKVAGVRQPSDRVNELYFLEAQAPAWSLSYAGAGHHNFSDLGYVGMLKNYGMNGPADGYATGVLIQKHLSAFFGKFLKGDAQTLDFVGPQVKVEAR